MKNKLFISALIITTLGLFAPHVLRAQDEPLQDEPSQDGGLAQPDQQSPDVGQAQPDQAAPGVARVSIIQGEVSTTNGDAGEWVASTVNAPLQRGDKVSTGDRSRTEIQLDYANVLRLDQQSQANIADLTSSRVQLQVAQGNVNYDVLKGSEAEVEIDTPNVAVHPSGEGSYRINVDPNSGQTVVTVRKGQAEITTPQGSTTVKQGQSITIQGTDNPQYQVNDASGRDDWDEWNQKRDSQILHAQSWSHTNKYYTGTEDLDRYGHWNNVDGYGQVWTPDASSDWAPYQDGRWVSEPYYGRTWVSYEPWGWAPYHYGRWFYYGSSWNWWPGPVYSNYYPLWSPAYVSFFGFGGDRFSVGLGFGSIGWCPLGPHDSFYPWYGRGFHNDFRNGGFGNRDSFGGNRISRPMPPLATGGRYPRMSNIESAYTNANVRRGITTVSARDFGNGRVPRNGSPISASALRGGRMVQGSLPVAPTRQSLSPTGRSVTAPASAARAQTFTSRSQTTSAMGRNPSTDGAQTFSGRGSANRAGQFATQSNGGSNVRSGWQGFGQPAPYRNTQTNLGNRPGAGGRFAQNNQATSPGRSSPQSYSNVPRQAAPSVRSAPSSGWQRFSRPSGQGSGRTNTYSAPRSQPAPRSNYRPSVGMSKPIVSERAPSGSYGGGGSSASGYYNNRGGTSAGGGYSRGSNAPSASGYYNGRGGTSAGGGYSRGSNTPSASGYNNGRSGSSGGGYYNGGNRGGAANGSYGRGGGSVQGSYSGGGSSGGGYSRAPSSGGYSGGGGSRGGSSGAYSGGGSRGGSYGGYGGGGGNRGGSSGGYSGGGRSAPSGGSSGGGNRGGGSSRGGSSGGSNRGGSSSNHGKH